MGVREAAKLSRSLFRVSVLIGKNLSCITVVFPLESEDTHATEPIHTTSLSNNRELVYFCLRKTSRSVRPARLKLGVTKADGHSLTAFLKCAYETKKSFDTCGQ